MPPYVIYKSYLPRAQECKQLKFDSTDIADWDFNFLDKKSYSNRHN